MIDLAISHNVSFCILFTLVKIHLMESARTVELGWDLNTEKNLAGYKIAYAKTPRFITNDIHTTNRLKHDFGDNVL